MKICSSYLSVRPIFDNAGGHNLARSSGKSWNVPNFRHLCNARSIFAWYESESLNSICSLCAQRCAQHHNYAVVSTPKINLKFKSWSFSECLTITISEYLTIIISECLTITISARSSVWYRSSLSVRKERVRWRRRQTLHSDLLW